MQKLTDFVVIGSGIAGLNAARVLADYGNVLLITKAALSDSATQYAQGGIAAVTSENDSFKSHIDDTLLAGSYHNNTDAVSFLVKHAPEVITELLQLGVPFDKNVDGEFSTSFEAAHSYPRIFHASDFTGREIEKALINSVRKNKNIEIWEQTFAIDLLVKGNQCFGVTVLKNEEEISIFSRGTVLATGGVGQLYQWTTNPFVATGDGIAMAYRAGAKLCDLEFVQFHPTALQEKGRKRLNKGQPQGIAPTNLFLLSEALRGEGGVLMGSDGKTFMQEFHPQGDLAPRDVVARAIFTKQKEGTVSIDLRSKSKDFLLKRFPNIYKELKKRGYELATDLIPVTPAAHFICGGIVTDTYGRTSIKNLFAYGEVAATGVHGANRLASNSLLEGFVFSEQIKQCITALPEKVSLIPLKKRNYSNQQHATAIKNQIKEIMWQYVGIERTGKNLLCAIQKLTELQKEFKGNLEEKNMLQVSLLIAQAAYQRKKSLGTHSISH